MSISWGRKQTKDKWYAKANGCECIRSRSYQKRQRSVQDKVLSMIVKLNNASVVFTAFDDLFKLWLGRALSLTLDLEVCTYLSGLQTLLTDMWHQAASISRETVQPGSGSSRTL